MGNEQSQSGGGYQRPPGDEYPGNVATTPTSASRSTSSIYDSRDTYLNRGGGVPIGNASAEQASSAADRAAALEARLAKKKPKPKDIDAIKDAHWKRYNELGASNPEPTPIARQEIGHRLADSAVIRREVSPPPVTAAATVSASAPPPVSSNTPGMIPGINRSRAAPTADQLMNGQKRYETPDEAAIRAQRAAKFAEPKAAKAAKAAQGKQDRWKTYAELEANSNGSENVIMNAPLPFALPSSSTSPDSMNMTPSPAPAEEFKMASPASLGPSPFATSPSASSSSAPASSSAASNAFAGNDYFNQQMQYLLGKARKMPESTITLLRKILQNLLKAGDNPDAEGMKFRKIKMMNPKMMESIAKVDGAPELLYAVGFVHKEFMSTTDLGTMEHFLFFPDNTSLAIAQVAYQELNALKPAQ